MGTVTRMGEGMPRLAGEHGDRPLGPALQADESGPGAGWMSPATTPFIEALPRRNARTCTRRHQAQASYRTDELELRAMHRDRPADVRGGVRRRRTSSLPRHRLRPASTSWVSHRSPSGTDGPRVLGDGGHRGEWRAHRPAWFVVAIVSATMPASKPGVGEQGRQPATGQPAGGVLPPSVENVCRQPRIGPVHRASPSRCR